MEKSVVLTWKSIVFWSCTIACLLRHDEV